jgi:hypothetical protein
VNNAQSYICKNEAYCEEERYEKLQELQAVLCTVIKVFRSLS